MLPISARGTPIDPGLSTQYDSCNAEGVRDGSTAEHPTNSPSKASKFPRGGGLSVSRYPRHLEFIPIYRAAAVLCQDNMPVCNSTLPFYLTVRAKPEIIISVTSVCYRANPSRPYSSSRTSNYISLTNAPRGLRLGPTLRTADNKVYASF